MPYLKLIELATRDVAEVRDDLARLGRSPECTMVLSGERAGVVSGVHAEIRHGVAGWLLIDLASLNGTFVNGRRLTGEGLLKAGDVIGLGETGPRIAVAAVAEQTTAEAHDDRRTPPGGRAYAVTLLDLATGQRHEARGIRIRLGRGRECEVPLLDSSDRIVSRIHAELTVGPTGALVVCDVDGSWERRLGFGCPPPLGAARVCSHASAMPSRSYSPRRPRRIRLARPVAPPRDKGGDA